MDLAPIRDCVCFLLAVPAPVLVIPPAGHGVELLDLAVLVQDDVFSGLQAFLREFVPADGRERIKTSTAAPMRSATAFHGRSRRITDKVIEAITVIVAATLARGPMARCSRHEWIMGPKRGCWWSQV
jgi:hypothetical protein